MQGLGEGLDAASKLPLRHLDLDSNWLDCQTLRAVAAFTGLTQLKLGDATFDYTSLQHLNTLQSLRRLDASGCRALDSRYVPMLF